MFQELLHIFQIEKSHEGSDVCFEVVSIAKDVAYSTAFRISALPGVKKLNVFSAANRLRLTTKPA